MIEKTYEIICPNCQKKNKIFVQSDENFNNKEDVHCDFCGEKMAEVPAAKPPRVECNEK